MGWTTLLSQLTLQHLYDRPLLDGRGEIGEIDAVMRVNYDIDAAAFARIADWTVGTLKDFLLAAPVEEVSGIGAALTGVMAAAVAKLMDAHELIFAARKSRRAWAPSARVRGNMTGAPTCPNCR